MKKLCLGSLIVILIGSIGFIGCTQKSGSGAAAVDTAKAMESFQEQLAYLEKQADKYFEARQYEDVITVCAYITDELNDESPRIPQMLEEAKRKVRNGVNIKISSPQSE